jgi:hypothetical protein
MSFFDGVSVDRIICTCRVISRVGIVAFCLIERLIQ